MLFVVDINIDSLRLGIPLVHDACLLAGTITGAFRSRNPFPESTIRSASGSTLRDSTTEENGVIV